MSESIFGIILLCDGEISPHFSLYGRTLLQWVSGALGDFDKSVAIKPQSFGDDLPACLKPYLKQECEYTVVLYSDTPLVSKKTVSDALSELSSTQQNVIRLTRGYVFRTSYLQECDKLYAPPHFYADEEDFLTVNGTANIPLVADILRHRILDFHLKNGVVIYDTASVYIDATADIGKGTTIFPNNHITGNTSIGQGCVLKPGNSICDSIIGNNITLISSNIQECKIGDNTTVGPYAYIRPHTEIGQGCRVGDFVELKNCRLGDFSKVSHLSYCGDCEIGSNCNIGCGVVFANYNGTQKFSTTLGDNVFVGSNSNLIAPLKLEDNSFVAAGSTITDDVPQNAMAIARARQVIKPDWRKPK